MAGEDERAGRWSGRPRRNAGCTRNDEPDQPSVTKAKRKRSVKPLPTIIDNTAPIDT